MVEEGNRKKGDWREERVDRRNDNEGRREERRTESREETTRDKKVIEDHEGMIGRLTRMTIFIIKIMHVKMLNIRGKKMVGKKVFLAEFCTFSEYWQWLMAIFDIQGYSKLKLLLFLLLFLFLSSDSVRASLDAILHHNWASFIVNRKWKLRQSNRASHLAILSCIRSISWDYGYLSMPSYHLFLDHYYFDIPLLGLNEHSSEKYSKYKCVFQLGTNKKSYGI